MLSSSLFNNALHSQPESCNLPHSRGKLKHTVNLQATLLLLWQLRISYFITINSSIKGDVTNKLNILKCNTFEKQVIMCKKFRRTFLGKDNKTRQRTIKSYQRKVSFSIN